jgi:hypothetical protein
VLSALALALGVAAAVAGVTGTWSPCGFSMVETLSSRGPWGRRGSIGACLTFTAGALTGGAITFGGLSAVGAALQTAGHPVPAAVAAAIALAAAIGEARGARVVPQVRRQVPESWRRTLPLPLAACLYGVLLGLGFTTFVLTFGVWALAAICLALGDPVLGLAVGLGFGLGRALPVALLAPIADSELGVRAVEAMAERPAALRRLRLTESVAMAACALAIGVDRADAAVPVASPGTDPAAGPKALAWDVPGEGWALRTGGRTYRLGGSDPAVGGRRLAWRLGKTVTVTTVAPIRLVRQLRIAGVEKLAVDARWLVYRRRRADGGDTIAARSLRAPRRERVIASVRPPAQLGRPALRGNAVAYHVVQGRRTWIVLVDLPTHHRRTLRRGAGAQVLNPSIAGSRLLYVVIARCRQELRVAGLHGGRSRVLMRIGGPGSRDAGHEPGHTSQGSGGQCPPHSPPPSGQMLWTTALYRGAAYVTRLLARPDGSTRPTIVRVRA